MNKAQQEHTQQCKTHRSGNMQMSHSSPSTLRQIYGRAISLPFSPSFLPSFILSVSPSSPPPQQNTTTTTSLLPYSGGKKNPLLHEERPTRKHSSTPRSFCKLVTTVNSHWPGVTAGDQVVTADRYGSWLPDVSRHVEGCKNCVSDAPDHVWGPLCHSGCHEALGYLPVAQWLHCFRASSSASNRFQPVPVTLHNVCAAVQPHWRPSSCPFLCLFRR